MEAKRQRALLEVLGKCGIHLNTLSLLNTALTHPTFVFENKHLGIVHNQRLEFLGDAVLGLVVGEYLYHLYPHMAEGDLTKMRAAVVCESALARKARELNLGSYILMGRGEELTGGRERASILADAFEAVIGAFYLELGLEEVRTYIIGQLDAVISGLGHGNYGDYKTLLQETVQKEFEDNVAYLILQETGPDHNKRFVVGVTFRGRLLAEGVGRSKKEAEQKAAQVALENWKRQV
ncbi:MAG: ribonuclease III [Bacillota bacterium]